MKLFSKAALAVVLVFTLMLSGCSLFEPDEKSFSKAGMTVTLTEAFVEQDVVNYTATYVSTKIMVYALKEEFSLLGSETDTLDKYIDLIKEINDFDDKVETDEGLKYITVETEGNGDKYTYLVAFYEAEDAFWMIQFGTKSSNFDKYKDDMLKYAKSVKLD